MGGLGNEVEVSARWASFVKAVVFSILLKSEKKNFQVSVEKRGKLFLWKKAAEYSKN